MGGPLLHGGSNKTSKNVFTIYVHITYKGFWIARKICKGHLAVNN